MQWQTIAADLTDLGNSGNRTDMSDMFCYGFRLLVKNAEKDNGMIVSYIDSRSASNHAVASYLVSDSEGKKLSDCSLLLGNSGLRHLPCIIFV